MTVELENLADFDVGFSFGEMCGVTFLPKVFSSAKEGFWVIVSNYLKILFFPPTYEDS